MSYLTLVFYLLVAVTVVISAPNNEIEQETGLRPFSAITNKQASIWVLSYAPTLYSNIFRCTGAVIGQEFVLTSATCVNWLPKEVLEVSEAHDPLSASTRFTKVSKVTVNTELDMAIIRVSVADFFAESSVSQMVQDPLLTGDKCIVSGWHFGTNEWEEQTVSYMTSADCKQAYSSVTDVINESLICATPEIGNSSCKESLGWTMVCNGQLTGMFSWTHYSCERPRVYSSIKQSLPWIDEVKGTASTVTCSTLLAALAILININHLL